jgi:hypothetical protein
MLLFVVLVVISLGWLLVCLFVCGGKWRMSNWSRDV